nr:photosystem I protein M [Pinus tabuliformis var. henryi]
MEELKFLIACFLAFTTGLLLAIKFGQALYD